MDQLDQLLWAVVVVGAIASVTDLTQGKIYNWLTLPAAIAGIAFSTYWGGWEGLGQALLGILVALGLYGWMFWIRMMGAGDVKLLMAFGAWGGMQYALRVGVLGVFVGGALAVVLLAFKGRLLTLIKKLYRFILSVVVKELVLETPQVDRKLTMPYGIPISIAAVWILIDDPLKKWGML